MHGDDDQIVPIPDSAMLSSKLLKNATLKVYNGFPHGMCTTGAETINRDLLARPRLMRPCAGMFLPAQQASPGNSCGR